jgi:hypothetical protein
MTFAIVAEIMIFIQSVSEGAFDREIRSISETSVQEFRSKLQKRQPNINTLII